MPTRFPAQYNPTWDARQRDENDSIRFMRDYAEADYDPATWASNTRVHVDWEQAARDAEALRAAREKGNGGGRGGAQKRPYDLADWDRNARHRTR